MLCEIFGDVEQREQEERKTERGRCFAKQSPHKRNNHIMRQLHNHCTSCCCHVTHSISYLHAQIEGFYYSTKQLIRQLIVQVLC
jgi:hypothetical protein